MNSASFVSKVWSFFTTLRDDGVGYGDYLKQLTYLIFHKMADEYASRGRDWRPSRRGVGGALHHASVQARLALTAEGRGVGRAVRRIGGPSESPLVRGFTRVSPRHLRDGS